VTATFSSTTVKFCLFLLASGETAFCNPNISFFGYPIMIYMLFETNYTFVCNKWLNTPQTTTISCIQCRITTQGKFDSCYICVSLPLAYVPIRGKYSIKRAIMAMPNLPYLSAKTREGRRAVFRIYFRLTIYREKAIL
jgi:hypothetical protein